MKAKLTAEEQKAWDFAFAYYCENGWVDEKAAELAWKDLQAEFPRLRKFEGAEA